MLLEFKDKVSIIRKSPVDGSETIIYDNIEADIQEVLKYNLEGDNSLNSEKINLLVFLKKNKKDLKTGDLIKYNNVFGEEILAKLIDKSYIDFKYTEDYIEIRALKL